MFKKNLMIVAVFIIAGLFFFNGCHPRPRFCQDDFAEKILNRMDSHIADLDLRDDQRGQYNNIRAEIKNDLGNFKAERQKVHEEIKAELNSKNPDMKKIAETLKKGRDKHPAKFESYTDKFLAFYNILDDNQKSKVVKKLKNLSGRFDCN